MAYQNDIRALIGACGTCPDGAPPHLIVSWARDETGRPKRRWGIATHDRAAVGEGAETGRLPGPAARAGV